MKPYRLWPSLLVLLTLVVLLACDGGDQPVDAGWDAVVSAYDRMDYRLVLSTLDAIADDEAPPEAPLYRLLATLQLGLLAESRDLIPQLAAPSSLDRIDLTDPVRFLPLNSESSDVIDVYVRFLNQLWESGADTAANLRLLETTRIMVQRYGSADWLHADVAQRLKDLEADLRRYMSDVTPIGSVRTGVE